MRDLDLSLLSKQMSAYGLVSLSAGALAMAFMSGCVNRTPSVRAPSYQANIISSTAFELLDSNKDNKLDEKELALAPGLKAALGRIDSNRDGAISIEELEARIAEYQKANVGLRNETYTFTLNGAPLNDASVVFVPETFFADYVQGSEGLTGSNGNTSVKITGNKMRGMTCGMYRVSVSKKDASGKELLPAKYNTETTLGYEVPPQESSADKDRTFTLTTR